MNISLRLVLGFLIAFRVILSLFGGFVAKVLFRSPIPNRFFKA